MPIVQAKCTNCGANLEVDNAKEAAVCQYCDSAFIVEKAINNYTNYITNEYHAQVINVYGTDEAFETDGHKLIAYKGNSRDVYIPVHITEIGDDAFRGNINIEHVFLHDGIRIIGNYAFGLCSNLKQVVLSKNLWLVGHHAFAGCTSLNAIELPDSITTIKHFAFDSCESLEEIVLPQKLTVIQCRSFCNCKNLRKVTIPNSVTKIETEVFVHCDNLKELVIPASVTHLDGFVFMQCNLDRLVFEDADRVTHITSALFLLNNKVPEIVATNSFKARYGQYLATQDAELSKTLNSLSGNTYGSASKERTD